MSGIPNHSLHSLITSTDTVRKIFIKTLFIVKSNDFSCVLLIGPRCVDVNEGRMIDSHATISGKMILPDL